MSGHGANDSERALQGLVRAALAASVSELDGGPLIRAAAQVLAPNRPLFAGVDSSFASIRLQGQPGGDEPLALLPISPALLAPVLARPAKARVVELESRGGASLGCEVVSVGPQRAADDVARACAAAGLTADRARQTQEVIAELDLGPCTALSCRRTTGGAVRWQLRFVGKNHTPAAMTATRDAFLRVAPRFGVTDPQRAFIDSTHPRLASGRPSAIGISLDPSGWDLALEYVDPTWTTAVELFQGFWPAADAGRRLGLFAGALDAQHPAMIRIELGPDEPPPVAVWARAG